MRQHISELLIRSSTIGDHPPLSLRFHVTYTHTHTPRSTYSTHLYTRIICIHILGEVFTSYIIVAKHRGSRDKKGVQEGRGWLAREEGERNGSWRKRGQPREYREGHVTGIYKGTMYRGIQRGLVSYTFCPYLWRSVRVLGYPAAFCLHLLSSSSSPFISLSLSFSPVCPLNNFTTGFVLCLAPATKLSG